MPSLKVIRKRITSVQSTQKITRAMKMVAGARLNRAQQRIVELRPYAKKTHEVLAAIAVQPAPVESDGGIYGATSDTTAASEPVKPEPLPEIEVEVGGQKGMLDTTKKPSPLELLATRPEKRVLILVLTSDRGLCGAFNTNINKRAELEWKGRTAEGQSVNIMVIGRKGRDYMNRRSAPVGEYFAGVWDKLSLATAQSVGKKLLAPFLAEEVDAIYLVYNEFKSAVTQTVVCERLLPVPPPPTKARAADADGVEAPPVKEYMFEPHKDALLSRLVPMYVDISILRALYESQASELGAKLTAMDAATKNAKEMIASLTLAYNKARQAAITKELMEIIGGSEALKE